MQTSYSPSPHNRVDYYLLPNGYADVFLHRNEIIETDEEGNKQYVAEEMYFQIMQEVTKEKIEENFDYMWEDAATDKRPIPTQEERISALESAVLEIIIGGSV